MLYPLSYGRESVAIRQFTNDWGVSSSLPRPSNGRPVPFRLQPNFNALPRTAASSRAVPSYPRSVTCSSVTRSRGRAFGLEERITADYEACRRVWRALDRVRNGNPSGATRNGRIRNSGSARVVTRVNPCRGRRHYSSDTSGKVLAQTWSWHGTAFWP